VLTRPAGCSSTRHERVLGHPPLHSLSTHLARGRGAAPHQQDPTLLQDSSPHPVHRLRESDDAGDTFALDSPQPRPPRPGLRSSIQASTGDWTATLQGHRSAVGVSSNSLFSLGGAPASHVLSVSSTVSEREALRPIKTWRINHVRFGGSAVLPATQVACGRAHTWGAPRSDRRPCRYVPPSLPSVGQRENV
jgi:hypothetical protein